MDGTEDVGRVDRLRAKNPLRVRFIRDVAITGGAQMAQAGSAMIAGILVARALGPSAKGELSVLTALAAMSVIVASLGLHQSAVYFLGRFKEDRDAVISNNALVGLGGGLLTAIALGLAGVAFRDTLISGISLSVFLVFLLFVPFNYFNEFGRRVMLGAGRVGLYNLPDFVLGAGLIVGTSVALIVFGDELMPLVVLRVVIEVAIAVVLVYHVGRAIGFRLKPARGVLGRQASYGVKNYASSLLWIVLLQSDLVLCNHFLGNAPTGVYSIAISIGLPLTMLGGVLGTIIFQRVSADESEANRVANTNRVVRVLVPTLAVASIALGAVSGWLIPAIYGAEFGAASEALLWLLPGLVALAVELVLMNHLAGEGSPPIVYLGPLAGLIVNLGANLYMIPRFGIDGAAATSSVGYLVVLLLVGRSYLRRTGSRLRDLVAFRRVDLGLGRPAVEGSGR
jgi:O-antigen/teichoic acid export membrane protein